MRTVKVVQGLVLRAGLVLGMVSGMNVWDGYTEIRSECGPNWVLAAILLDRAAHEFPGEPMALPENPRAFAVECSYVEEVFLSGVRDFLKTHGLSEVPGGVTLATLMEMIERNCIHGDRDILRLAGTLNVVPVWVVPIWEYDQWVAERPAPEKGALSAREHARLKAAVMRGLGDLPLLGGNSLHGLSMAMFNE